MNLSAVERFDAPLLPWSYLTPHGFTLRGQRTAPRGKPLLHVLHGNGFCGGTYEPLLARLSADFDLWLSDIQGHGDSDHGGAFVGWNRCAELAVAALQQHLPLYGEVPRYALGHSLGGALTCLAMAQHPPLFDRAVLLDPMLFSRRVLWLLNLARWGGLQRRHGLAVQAGRRRATGRAPRRRARPCTSAASTAAGPRPRWMPSCATR